MPITALSTTGVTYTTPAITWNEYVGQLGDIPAPVKARIVFTVRHAGTGSTKPSFITLNSGGQVTTETRTETDLSAKTNYYVDAVIHALDADDSLVQGIPQQVFARCCFMTGGTYTMNVDPNDTQGRNSGCFTISPLTFSMSATAGAGARPPCPCSAQPRTTPLS